MKLISMLEFVLERYEKCREPLHFQMQCFMYAKLLSQPLTLGMFVPCDEDGNVLDNDPILYGSNSGWEEKYKKAKDRVLFEVFEIGYKSKISIIPEIQINGKIIELRFGVNGYLKPLGNNYESIEDLTNKGISLTKSAQKQIGL